MSVLSFFKRRGSNSSDREQHEQMEQFAIRGLSMDISDFYSALDSKSEEERHQLLNIYNNIESNGSKSIDPFDISMRKLMILNDDIHSIEVDIKSNRVFVDVPRDDKPFPQSKEEYELYLRTEPLYRQGTPPESYEQAQEKFHAYEKAKDKLDIKKEEYKKEASHVIGLFEELPQIKQLDTLAHISLVCDRRTYSEEESYESLMRKLSFLNIKIFSRSEPSFHPVSFFPPVNSDVFNKLKEQYATKHNISMELYETTFPDYCSTDVERLIQTAKENMQRIKQTKQAKQENATQTPVTQGKKSRH